MSAKVDRNREMMRSWLGVLNTGDWGKIKRAYEEFFTPGYLLHDPDFPNQVKTFDQFIADFEAGFPRMKNIKATLEECIGEGELLASRAIFEWVDAETGKKSATLYIFFSRFEGDRVAEEWQVTAEVV